MELRSASVFVVDPQPIFRRGVISCLTDLALVAAAHGVDSPETAWDHPALLDADLVLIDVAAAGAIPAIERLAGDGSCRVLATAGRWQQSELLEAMDAGAHGVVCKHDLTPDALLAQVAAALCGAGVMPPEIIDQLVRGHGGRSSTATTAPQGRRFVAQLTSREQVVLKLIADGRLIREVAIELCYSERTVKTVLSTAVAKLGARSRSQAVAHAVREGII